MDTSPDTRETARSLGVSERAVEIHRAAGLVDLHNEAFIWTRLAGYRLAHRHRHSGLGGRLFGQTDLPRMIEAGLGATVMSIATNPLRPAQSRRAVTRRNVARLTRVLDAASGVSVVSDASGYDDARARGDVACFVALQGADAIDPDDLSLAGMRVVTRLTLVHLTRNRYGAPSSALPLALAQRHGRGQGRGLTADGARMIEAMRERAVLLDLAHASPETFAQALDVHGTDIPVIVSHSGVRGVRDSWRNLDDDQIRAIAGRHGVVGVILHQGYLTRPGWRARAADVVRHLDHLIAVGGLAVAAIGTDYDGFIVPPRDLRSVIMLPRLTQAMLDRGHTADAITAVLATNAMGPLRALRPGAPTSTSSDDVLRPSRPIPPTPLPSRPPPAPNRG
jgi:membrane dipeptidase